jgi:hypothetical protein
MTMLNGRLYRATLVPVVIALAIAAFSLTTGRPALVSTLAPDAFSGVRAFSELKRLAGEFPDRRPGSPGDQRLAGRVSQALAGLGGTAGGGFSVRTRSFSAQTIDGERTLTTVIAQRPGSTNAAPIVIIAHRDGATPAGSQTAGGSAGRAELSGTAALLELARVFAASETRRTIVLVSTSGGSGGGAGAADFAAHSHGPFDAAIALGDLAGAHLSRLFVVPYSDGLGSAPEQLQRTVAGAIARETGATAGAPSSIGQLAHLAFPLAVGEQGVLNARGLPAVLVQVGGERGPSAREPVSAERLAGFGRGVLSAVDALDSAPDISAAKQSGMPIEHKTIPAWALRLLGGALLLGPLIVLADGLARVRRRREPIGRWTWWTLTCALPFFAAAVFARLLGLLGIVSAAPSVPALPGALPFDGSAAAAVLAVVLVLVLAWLAWPGLVRRLGLGVRPDPNVAGLAMLLVLLSVCLVVWVVNPFTALLVLPALHLWLIVVSPELRPRRPGALTLVGLGLVPLGLLVWFYAEQLGLSPSGVLWTAVLLVAGGHIGILGAMLWSLALGCAALAIMLALRAPALPARVGAQAPARVTIRGPRSYAGPGSLGGTESALRR